MTSRFIALYDRIQQFFLGEGEGRGAEEEIQAFVQTLREHKDGLLKPGPFDVAPPSTEHRNQVSNGLVPEAWRGPIIQMSADLLLDELQCVEYWRAVASLENRTVLEQLLGAEDGSLKSDLPSTLAVAAKELFLLERGQLLRCVCELIKARRDEIVSKERLGAIITITNSLVVEGLPSRLIECLRQMLPEESAGLGGARKGGEDRTRLTDSCRLVAAEALFFTFYDTQATAEEVQELLQLLRDCSTRLSKMAQHHAHHSSLHYHDYGYGTAAAQAQDQNDASWVSMFNTTLILVLTLACCLSQDQQLRDRSTGVPAQTTGNALLPSGCAPENASGLGGLMRVAMEERWHHRQVQAVVQIVWAQFMAPSVFSGMCNKAQVEDPLVEALKGGAFSFLRGPVLASRRFLAQDIAGCSSSSNTFYAEILMEVTKGFLDLVSDDRLEMSYELDTGLAFDDAEAPFEQAEALDKDGLDQVVLYMAELCELYPAMTSVLLEGFPKTPSLELLSQKLQENASLLLHPVLDYLAALASGPVGNAEKVFEYLAERPFGWGHLLSEARGIASSMGVEVIGGPLGDKSAPRAIGHLRHPGGRLSSDGSQGAQQHLQQQQQQQQQLAPKEQQQPLASWVTNLFVTVARLLQRVLQNPVAKRELLDERYNVLGTLLRLHACPVQAKLKGSVLKAIAASLVDSSSGMSDPLLRELPAWVWGQIEAMQLVPTARWTYQKSQDGEGGVPAELELNEAQAREYPLTDGFCGLMAKLAMQPLPYQLGGGYREAGMAPYMDFLLEGVLLKAEGRAYRYPGEKWRVIGRVLEVFCAVLAHYPIGEEGTAPLADDEDRKQCVLDFDVQAVKDQRPRSPGFMLMAEVLCRGRLLRVLVGVLSPGGDAAKALAAERQSAAESSLLSVLREQREGGVRRGRAVQMSANGELVEATFQKRQEAKAAVKQESESDWSWWHERCVLLAMSLLQAVAHREGGEGGFIQRLRREPSLLQVYQRGQLLPITAPLPLAELLADQTHAGGRRGSEDGYGYGRRSYVLCAIPRYVEYSHNTCIPLLATSLLMYMSKTLPPDRLLAALGETGEEGPLVRAFVRRLMGMLPQQCVPAAVAGICAPLVPPGGDHVDKDLSSLDARLVPLQEELLAPQKTPLGGAVEDVVQTSVLYLLLQNMREQPVPNLAHLLLGRGIVGSRGMPSLGLQEDKSPTNCLEAVLDLLEGDISPEYADICMELLYCLVSSPATYLPVLTLLGSARRRFFTKMVLRNFGGPATRSLRGVGGGGGGYGDLASGSHVSHLNARAWLLRCLAIDLHVASRGGSRKLVETETLLSLLFHGVSIGGAGGSGGGVRDGGELRPDSAAAVGGDGGAQCCPILEVLDDLGGVCDAGPDGKPESHMLNVMEECTYQYHGPADLPRIYLVDEGRLAATLRRMRTAEVPTAGSGSGSYQDEIDNALKWAAQWNAFVLKRASQAHVVEAWRQVVEVALISCRQELLVSVVGGNEDDFSETLGRLLSRMLTSIGAARRVDILLATPLAHACLTLMGAQARLLSSAGHSSERRASPTGSVKEFQRSSMEEFPHVFQQLLEAVLQPAVDAPNSNPGLYRSHLYGCLLLHLRRCSPSHVSGDAAVQLQEDAQALAAHNRLVALKTLDQDEGYLEHIVARAGTDAVNTTGLDESALCQRSALSLLAALFGVFSQSAGLAPGGHHHPQASSHALREEMDFRGRSMCARAVQVLCKKSLMRKLVDMLGESQTLLPGGGSRKRAFGTTGANSAPDTSPACVGEAISSCTVALFTQIAGREEGAKALLEHGVIKGLAGSQRLAGAVRAEGLDLHDFWGAAAAGSASSVAAAVLRDVQLPCLQLLQALLVALPCNSRLAGQCLDLVKGSYKACGAILRMPEASLTAVRAAGVLSSVLAHLAPHEHLWRERLSKHSDKLSALVCNLLVDLGQFPLPPQLTSYGNTGPSQVTATAVAGRSGQHHQQQIWWIGATPQTIQEQLANSTDSPAPSALAEEHFHQWTVFDSLKLAAGEEALQHAVTFLRARSFLSVDEALGCAMTMGPVLEACLGIVQMGARRKHHQQQQQQPPPPQVARRTENDIQSSMRFVMENLMAVLLSVVHTTPKGKLEALANSLGQHLQGILALPTSERDPYLHKAARRVLDRLDI